MAFVSERKDQWSEDDRQRVAALSASLGERIPPSSWVIDRERDLVFLCLSVGRQSIHEDEREAGHYVLFVGKSVVKVEAHMLFAGPEHEHYLVTRVTIPKELQALRAQILADLRDTFVVKGKSYSIPKNVIKEVVVEFKGGRP